MGQINPRVYFCGCGKHLQRCTIESNTFFAILWYDDVTVNIKDANDISITSEDDPDFDMTAEDILDFCRDCRSHSRF